MKVNIKPLSINQCFQGRRFKTPKYKQYEKELMILLPALNVPSGLLEVVITFGLSSKLNDIILDSFLGSGSTLMACEKTNRKCYGMELDEKYCDVIINRWEQFTGLKATIINGTK